MTSRQRSNLTIASLIAACLLLSGAVAVPTVVSIQGLTTKIDSLQGRIDREHSQRQFTRNALIELNRSRPMVNQLTESMVIIDEELPLIESLEQAAGDANIRQNISIQLSRVEHTSPWAQRLPVSIDLNGNYENLLLYLYKLDRLTHYLEYQELDIRHQPLDSRSPTIVSAHLELAATRILRDHPGIQCRTCGAVED
jgi:Tfp pilus assembly protein PilO